MNYNKPFVRVVLIVVLALLTGAYLFTQTTLKPLPPILHQYHYNNPAALTYPHDRFKAAFYTFVKSDSTTLTRLRYTIRNLEDSFNKEFNYPYIIFTDEHLSTEYQELASSLTKANVLFQRVGSDLYGYPKAIDLKKAAAARVDLNSSMFGDSEDYRFQSRFMAGTIYRQAKKEGKMSF
jgi:alpha 1,2-mannosyltransferase